ncbi:MAG: Ig-like domain-containing protein [Eubacterium sp.]|nr:Ig-like domain-containing protein [Eubacterium sp.]
MRINRLAGKFVAFAMAGSMIMTPVNSFAAAMPTSSVSYLATAGDAEEDIPEIEIPEEGDMDVLGDTSWQSNFTYTLSGSNILISDYKGTATTVTIPATATIGGTNYTTQIAPAKISMVEEDYVSITARFTAIKNLTLESGVKLPDDCTALFAKCTALTTVDMSGVNTSNVTDMSHMFYGCTALTDVKDDFNTAKVTDMSYMFYNDTRLASVETDTFNTQNVTDMRCMFYYNSKLASVDLSGFNTSKVTNMKQMFYNCGTLKSLDFSGFDMSKVTSLEGFLDTCTGLTSVNFTGVSAPSVTSTANMFNLCSQLTTINLSSFSTPNVTDMSYMFKACFALETVNLSGLNTAKCTDFTSMFQGDSSLTELDLSKFDMSKSQQSVVGVLTSCTGLETIKTPKVLANSGTCGKIALPDTYVAGTTEYTEITTASSTLTKKVAEVITWVKLTLYDGTTVTTTPNGVQPTYPDRLYAHYTDGSKVLVDAEPVAQAQKNRVNNILNNPEGGSVSVALKAYVNRTKGDDSTRTLLGVAGYKVVVLPVAIESHTDPSDIEIDAGQTPELPEKVSVKYENGNTGTATVIWDEYDETMFSTPGTYTINGSISGYDAVVSVRVIVSDSAVTSVTVTPSTITVNSGTEPQYPAKATVKWKNGTTTQEPITWDETDKANVKYTSIEGGSYTVNGTCEGKDVSVTVIVKDATIVSVADFSPISTFVGYKPTTPGIANVTWSNGDNTTRVPIWDDIPAESYASVGSFTLNGVVRDHKGNETAVSVVINVTAIGIESITVNPESVEIEAGETITYPTTARVVWANGKTESKDVTWDEDDKTAAESGVAGTYTIHGTMEGVDGEALFTVVVKKAVATKTITGYDAVNVTTEFAVAPVMPTKVKVQWNDGTKSEENVTWDTIGEASYSQSGTFTVDGVVTPSSGATASYDVTATVTVNPLTALRATLKNSSITVPSGTEPTYPEKATVSWSNGTATEETIYWNEEDQEKVKYTERVGGSYQVSGTAAEKSVKLTITVSSATITSVDAVSVTTEEKKAPVLPSTLNVVWSNGDQSTESVTWNSIPSSDYATAGVFTVNGTVNAVKPTATKAVKAEVTVVKGAVTKERVYLEVTETTTPSGTAPTYPSLATILWSDGSTTSTTITWNTTEQAAVNYTAKDGGKFTVTGTASDTNLSFTVNVTPATITKTRAFADLTIIEGGDPSSIIPEIVETTWSNGDITAEVVTWEAIDPAKYNTPGTFKVTGTIADGNGSNYLVYINVIVNAREAVTVSLTNTSTTIPSGTAPEYPNAAKVTWNDDTVTEEEISWSFEDKSAVKYTAREGGRFSVNGTVCGKGVVFTVVVTPATIANTAALSDVSTEEGTAPVLPENASATWSNGDVTSEKITWTSIPKDYYATAGTFTVDGTITDLSGTKTTVSVKVIVKEKKVDPVVVVSATLSNSTITVPSGTAPIYPETAVVKWSDNTTTNEKITWTKADVDAVDYQSRFGGTYNVNGTVQEKAVLLKVIVTPATISEADKPADITVEVGTAPALPEKVHVIWSNGDSTEETVAWDNVPAASYSAAGSFTVNGSVTDPSNVKTTVTVNVTVKAATAVSAVLPASGTTVESGTAPQYPATATVTWSNGTKTEETVAYSQAEKEAVKYNEIQGGTYSVSGMAAGLGVIFTVTVKNATITGSASTAVETKVGTAPVLPTTVGISWSNGDNTNENVKWDSIDISKYSAAGTFTVNGTVTPDKVPNVSCTVTATVTVKATVSNKTISNVYLEKNSIETSSGTKPEYPSEATVKWSDNTTTKSLVEWDKAGQNAVAYMSRTGGNYSVNGVVKVSMPDGSVQERTVTLSIKVNAATAVSVSGLSDVTTIAQVAPVLPATASVTWSNQEVTTENVNWNYINPSSYASAGTFNVTGNAAGVSATIKVTVQAATVTSVVFEPTETTIESGLAPKYPTNATVTWNNGKTTNERITWDTAQQTAVNYKGRSGGTFTVDGTVQEKTVTFTVKVNPATITSIAKIDDVKTKEGNAPKIPATVECTWSNGDKTEENVAWSTIAADSYNTVGEFTVNGTVSDSTGTKDVTVKVIVEERPSDAKTLKAITVIPPTQLVYIDKNPLKLEGGSVTPEYDDGTKGDSVQLTSEDVEVSGYDSFTPGVQTVVVVYTDPKTYDTKTATFEVTVKWPFSDMRNNESGASEVLYAYNNDIIGGYGTNSEGLVTFKPAKYVTRAQFAIMLYKAAIALGYIKEGTGGSGSYSDVNSSMQCYNAVMWASSNGIISGFSNGTFKPNNNITRAQITIMLMKFAQKFGINTGNRDANFAQYTDGTTVGAAFQESMSWASAEKIMSGQTKGGVKYLNPNKNASRAQCAIFLVRFIKKFGN